jgi:hypothetical protein
MQIH